MCLAIPGKIKSIKTKTALVDYGFEIREVMLDPRIKIEVGNYVLVQMGMIIKRVSDKDAEVSLEEWKKATANIQGNSSS